MRANAGPLAAAAAGMYLADRFTGWSEDPLIYFAGRVMLVGLTLFAAFPVHRTLLTEGQEAGWATLAGSTARARWGFLATVALFYLPFEAIFTWLSSLDDLHAGFTLRTGLLTLAISAAVFVTLGTALPDAARGRPLALRAAWGRARATWGRVLSGGLGVFVVVTVVGAAKRNLRTQNAEITVALKEKMEAEEAAAKE